MEMNLVNLQKAIAQTVHSIGPECAKAQAGNKSAGVRVRKAAQDIKILVQGLKFLSLGKDPRVSIESFSDSYDFGQTEVITPPVENLPPEVDPNLDPNAGEAEYQQTEGEQQYEEAPQEQTA